MPHTDKNLPEFNREPDSNHRQQSLSSEIESVQAGMRIDFDQKLSELANLLARFKVLVTTPDSKAGINKAANDEPKPDAIAPAASVKSELPLVSQPLHTQKNGSSPVLKIASVRSDAGSTKIEPAKETAQIKPVGAYAPEPARFESGLYKLNCQLYRFRLELDQEMEFREEPLHVHFHQESELSRTLLKISDRSRAKNPDNL